MDGYVVGVQAALMATDTVERKEKLVVVGQYSTLATDLAREMILIHPGSCRPTSIRHGSNAPTSR